MTTKPTKANGMESALPWTVFGLSCLAVVTTVLVTLLWFTIVVDHDGRGARAIVCLIAPVLGGGSLLFAAIPSALFYCRWRQRRDLWSFLMSGASFLAVLAEAIALIFVPLHGPY